MYFSATLDPHSVPLPDKIQQLLTEATGQQLDLSGVIALISEASKGFTQPHPQAQQLDQLLQRLVAKYRLPPLGKERTQLLEIFQEKFAQQERFDRRFVKKTAKALGLEDLGFVYEVLELAWTKHYRKLIAQHEEFDAAFEAVLDFYQHYQPVYSYSDSNKKIFQQYSTAAPIALLAGWYCEAHSAPSVFEPSAGNGLLSIYAPYGKTTVNEIDPTRLTHLQIQPFAEVMQRDAGKAFLGLEKKFAVLLSNPPFGRLDAVDETFSKGQYPIRLKAMEQVMALHALETMQDTGRAALIIGGHTQFNKRGVIRSHRVFFNYLYHHYWVDELINIDSKKLYRKQGTGWPLRLILISGRKDTPAGFAPVAETLENRLTTPISDFHTLKTRVAEAKSIGYLRQGLSIELS